MKKLTTEEFIEKARKVHGDKYIYSKVNYTNSRAKVCIICPIHGEFYQQANSHLRGEGCSRCKVDKNSALRTLTTEEFIEKAKKIHGDKYDYSKVNYVNSQTKVCIVCPKHGEFWQTPNSHLHGSGCPSCAFNLLSSVNIAKSHGKGGFPTLTTEEFIEKAKKIHGDKYDYSKTKYGKNNKEKVCIICPEHGEFWQRPNAHLLGFGCYRCGRDIMGEKQTKSKEEFLKKAKQVHGDKYDYSKVEYINGGKKICIVCPKHGEFWQIPYNHLNGQGCPYCKESHLEIEIENLLKENNINYIKQCNKNTLKWLDKQSLDFYLPQHNMAIECQGEQHFRPVYYFGGEKEFLKIVERDNRKAKKCFKNNVKLIYFTNFSNEYAYNLIKDKNILLKIIKNENIN